MLSPYVTSDANFSRYYTESQSSNRPLTPPSTIRAISVRRATIDTQHQLQYLAGVFYKAADDNIDCVQQQRQKEYLQICSTTRLKRSRVPKPTHSTLRTHGNWTDLNEHCDSPNTGDFRCGYGIR